MAIRIRSENIVWNDRCRDYSLPSFRCLHPSVLNLQGGNSDGINPYQLYKPLSLCLDKVNQIFYISNEQSHSVTLRVIGDYENRNVYAGILGRTVSHNCSMIHRFAVAVATS